MTIHVSPEALPALVLNADFRPLSYYPLSLLSWQDAIKAVCLDRVNIVNEYDRVIKSPSFEMKLPISGRLRDGVLLISSVSQRNVSPGKTGRRRT